MTLFSVADPAPPAGVRDADFALAERHRPALMLDHAEPAPPLAMGYSVVREAQKSPSSKYRLMPPEGGAVIEYAIWHDWDIQHLYDLEHVWVHIDRQGNVVRVEGSMHGMRVSIDDGSGLPEMRNGRPVLYVEPGKHALWGVDRIMRFMGGSKIAQMCGREAGTGGIHAGNAFAEAGAWSASAREHRLARLAMKRAAFVPRFAFAAAEEPVLMPWKTLEAWIPARMRALIAALPGRVPHLSAVFLDCGDTLIDEATEVKKPGSEVVTEADEIPFAMDAVRTLHGLGYRLALVADGPRETFENMLKPRGIWDLMECHAISGDVGQNKPSPKMFSAALAGLGLGDGERSRIVMVGNNLARDIRGANDFGLISLFVGWSQRRTHEPVDASEEPHFRIDRLDQLVSRIEAIELCLPVRENANV
ncbi:HAD family hydrolase [Martelella sp. AD-3]|uniref:HAD family hydrolase n=1 Tax=Martelella sp. AD-3 TaxID=686597 RepID=UPI0004640604|nr:HAD family hydrolase [Martelella sp. AD-3]AMM84557.1 HAD family hydrolase [Martelella sp. AD-3]